MSEIHSQIMPSVAELVEVISKHIENPPEEITVSVTLKGRNAARYNFISEILKQTCNESEEEICKYLIILGVKQELAKLFGTMATIEKHTKEQK